MAAQAQPAMARELFAAGFVSCWGELDDAAQDALVRSLEAALAAPSIPPETVTALLNLAEFMEHDEKALPLDARFGRHPHTPPPPLPPFTPTVAPLSRCWHFMRCSSPFSLLAFHALLNEHASMFIGSHVLRDCAEPRQAAPMPSGLCAWLSPVPGSCPDLRLHPASAQTTAPE